MSLPLNHLIKRNAKPARVISRLRHYLFLVYFFFLISFVLYIIMLQILSFPLWAPHMSLSFTFDPFLFRH